MEAGGRAECTVWRKVELTCVCMCESVRAGPVLWPRADG